MTQNTEKNRKIILAERPFGVPDENTLRLETSEKPIAGNGEMLLQTEYLSLDPYMRGRMNDSKSSPSQWLSVPQWWEEPSHAS